MPSDFTLKAVNALHQFVVKVTRGRIGWRAAGMPVLELTTTGRTTGEPRAVLLTSPLRDGDSWVIVGSRGGDPQHPAWFLNIQSEPRVEVKIRGRTSAMLARVATPEERERMWPLVVAKYSGYGDYQKRTDREIPLVVLEPVALSEPPS